MAYWLVKTEPSSWSWEQQMQHKITHWDGVRNYQAANNLRAMRLEDQVLFYHSVSDKSIQGIVKVMREAYPDPSDDTGRFVMVDLQFVSSFLKPVSLETIKADPKLNHLALVRQSRLSVMPIDEAAWQYICQLGEIL